MRQNKVETNPNYLTSYRKRLRTNGTIAEATLWRYLKNKQIENIRFRQQFGIDKYILDFYAPELKLSIELDGSVHKDPQIDLHDYNRREFLNTQNITEIRFNNDEIHYKIDEVVNAITYVIKKLKENI